ncbi:MAG: hypothetical protein ABL914_11225 [Novosphingobium sp.]|uniref:hypothetical protein n=1 Tax=Novosphingobium sp. TaxID=1874826 RepID=UPI0032BD8550
MTRLMMLALAALILPGGVPARAPASRSLAPKPMTCAVPVGRGDTAASLKARFGAQAKLMKIHAAEGEMVSGMALWPGDPARRIDVFFDESSRKRVETIRITEPKSRWRIGGLGLGSRLDAVLRANGKAVQIGGFGWDYGGGVDPRGGKLAHWQGGCHIGLVMDVGHDVTNPPEGIYGDGLILNAKDPRLKLARPEVTKIYISWP